jgi:hypothetical protein
MRRLFPLGLSVSALVGVAVGQEPPRPLPPSIGGVTPAGGVPVPAAPGSQPPLAKFEPLLTFPPETRQAVFGVRTGGAWLARRLQPHGRFLFGVNPALRAPLDGDTDYRQAQAAWGLAAAARMTGDDRLAAAAGQAVLSLLAGCREDGDGKGPAGGPNPVGCAAALALAVSELPAGDPKVTAEGEKVARWLAKRQKPDGAWEAGAAESGLAMQALAAFRMHDPLARGLAFHRAAFRRQPTATLAGTVLPAAVDHALATGNGESAAAALEMGDWLCAAQVGRTDPKVQWAGGFRSPEPAAEPGFESAHAARGLAAGCQLLHKKVGDLARYAKYRPAAAEAVEFVRSLQYTADNTAHFEPAFRTEFLIGGVRTTATDGTIRADATGLAVTAFGRFLESGSAERR